MLPAAAAGFASLKGVGAVSVSRTRMLVAAVSAAGLLVALGGLPPAAAQEEPPFIEANVTSDIVNGFNWPVDTPVTIAATGGGSWTGDPADPNSVIEFHGDGSWSFYGSWNGLDVRGGQVQEITVSAPGSPTKTLKVADLRVTGYDLAGDTVTGTTDQTTGVFAYAWHPTENGWEQPSVSATIVAGGWTIDFAPRDLRVTDLFEAETLDADGDGTLVSAVLAGPRFTLGTEIQEVVGLDWPGGVLVTLTVTRSGADVYTATTMPVSPSEPYAGWLFTGDRGTVYFDLTAGSVQAQPGDVVTMANGTSTKQLTVPILTTRLPDKAASALSGTVTPAAGGFLIVGSDASWNGGRLHEVAVAGDGAWTTSFAEDGVNLDGMPYAYLTDADGDMVESHTPVPDVRVDPMADRIWAPDFGTEPGHTSVTLTVTRSGSVVATRTVTPTNVLTRGSWNLDMWAQRTGTLPRPTVALYDLKGITDIRAGDQILVSDGASTRSVSVADLSVDSANAVTDVMTGHATQTVGLHMGDGEGGYWGYQVEPVNGLWTYYFQPGVFPNPPGGIEPGMHLQAIVGATVVRVTAVSTPTQPSELVPSVKALRLKAGLERALLATLQAAQTAYTRHQDKVGNAAMRAFILQVRALRGTAISDAAATRLVADATAVIQFHAG